MLGRSLSAAAQKWLRLFEQNFPATAQRPSRRHSRYALLPCARFVPASGLSMEHGLPTAPRASGLRGTGGGAVENPAQQVFARSQFTFRPGNSVQTGGATSMIDRTKISRVTRKLFYAARHANYHRTGFCNVCKRRTVFVCLGASDRWIRSCCWCRSTPKYRAIIHVLENTTGETLQAFARNNRIYELTTTSPMFRLLRGNENYEASGYFSDRPFGIKLNDLYWNQDVQKLTFASESFDAVISSETMEHVRLPWQGFAEVHRVLKPAGIYIFTVPYHRDQKTVSRVETGAGKDVYVLPKVYHEDPYRPEDSLVYTDFGTDLPELLRPIGFDATLIEVLDYGSDIQDDLRPMAVFLATKTSAAPIGLNTDLAVKVQ